MFNSADIIIDYKWDWVDRSQWYSYPNQPNLSPQFKYSDLILAKISNYIKELLKNIPF